ncbi:hypothetical protein SPD57_00195 [Streptococcus sp. BJSWXB6CM1]|uniref:DUF4315 family protein n=1 Tax=Streptococcus fermentans TaxID=3095082 RepID=A0ABU5FWY6_9STRE|nr:MULTISPECIES: hypothetical protein [unclassified Streptococcus]AMH88512.1 hypothetical protein AXK38_04270 [Streptococcus mitis]MDY4345405.1 hypothetical protein [Streptococcus sp. BJSWXB5TM5]MDY4360210.1 hypothetical protein [Streptococcus sp. BJSWXB3CM3]MDY4370344.1 hypothetical protein [Streptococcus sp. BJSWXB6CM1]OFK02753.1 hypothetical protein HMPREF2837_09665 [Streptococcus sp. HMSC071D03]
MNKKIEQLEAKLERVRKDKKKAQQQKEAADEKIKNYINQEKDFEAQLFVALSEESGLSYQEMKELILPSQSSNQGVNHV